MAENTLSILAALFKYVYPAEVISAIPEANLLQKTFPMVPQEEAEGGAYWKPVRVSRAHGWTKNGTTGGAFPLNPAEPRRQTYATFRGSTFVGRETIGYKEAHALLKSKGDSRKRAFVSATSHMVESLQEMATFQQELDLLYGQDPVGILHATGAEVSGAGTVSQVKKFASSHWVPAIWEGMENGYVDFYSSGGTHRNPTTECQVTAVDLANQQITVSGNATELDAVTNGDYVYMRGSKTGGPVGAIAICSNTTGTIHGISGTDHSVWQGNSCNASSARVVFANLMEYFAKALNRGGSGKFTCCSSLPTFNDAMNDTQMLRQVTKAAGGTMEIGDNALVFYNRLGVLEMVPHIYLYPSVALIIPDNGPERCGTTDTTFGLPGAPRNLAEFTMLPDAAGYQMRIMYDLALFIPKPSHTVYIYGITNSGE